jgi:pimeloyl-ACP methyl ester carboxylesterase
MPILELEDANISYELTGRGEPVLFIQGCGVTGSGWRPQVEELAQDFQCLTFDNRGIGKSSTPNANLTVEQMANDAASLIEDAGWQSAHVVGHSLGGVIAQQLALNVPQRVRSLSLLCTFSKGSEGGRVTPWVLWMSLRTRIGSRRMRRRAFLEMLFSEEYLKTVSVDELAQQLAPVIGRDLADQPRILMKQVKALAAHDCSARLHELSRYPILVMSAEKDPIALPAYGRRLSSSIDGSRYAEIPGMSHGAPLQDPRTINELLRTHIVEAARQNEKLVV